MEIYAAIPRVMAEIGAVAKDSKNEQQRYNFRGIEAMYNAVHPAMVKHGVFCAPDVLERDVYRFDKTNSDGRVTTWIHVSIKVEHRFYASDGSSISVVTCGEGLDNSDKATNKAMSGAMKYALIELFCIPTADIEDSDKSSPEQGSRAKVYRKPAPEAEPVAAATPPPDTAVAASGAVVSGNVAAPHTPIDTIQALLDKGKPLFAESEYITQQQAGILARRFREACREEIRPNAETLRADFLRINGYIDKDGNPSSLMIPADSFVEIGKKAVAWVKGL